MEAKKKFAAQRYCESLVHRLWKLAKFHLGNYNKLQFTIFNINHHQNLWREGKNLIFLPLSYN